MLVLAATPIGNLADASQRLRDALQKFEFIAAEDTRVLRQLAAGLGVTVKAKLFSLHEHNEQDRISELLEIAKVSDLLVVSDAGMPTVSDPGFLLVRAAAEAGIRVEVIPGPSAVLSALALSGLATDRFCFEGFLPRKSGELRQKLELLRAEPRTMVFFESPHRVGETIAIMSDVFGEQRLGSISREITKKFEETVRGSLAELREWAQREVRGELVIVVAGGVVGEASVDLEALAETANRMAKAGLGLKQAVAEVAELTGASKSELYQRALDQKPRG